MKQFSNGKDLAHDILHLSTSINKDVYIHQYRRELRSFPKGARKSMEDILLRILFYEAPPLGDGQLVITKTPNGLKWVWSPIRKDDSGHSVSME